ncbi:MAG: RagB/SusD family nutrient uptake outer membrane protein [Bacteroidetes bacterium]|nr:RagB/SusD family nutrient uptake outer membrane protein [Bacteroidota bacterium]
MIFAFVFGLQVLHAQRLTVTGKITNPNGETLPGVTVVVKGTTVGTTSGMDGSFSISVPSGDAVLQFSFIGYAQNMQAMELESAWWGYSAPESWVQGSGGFEINWVDGWNPVPIDKRLDLLWENYTSLWWYYWCKKWRYEKYLGWAEHPQNYPIIRYADILLMHSEALNELKTAPDAEVVASINLVRNRAGVAEYNFADWTKATFREEIQNERNRELWGEGVTWFDYVRKGMLVSRMTAAGTTNVTDKFNLFPIPKLERENNPNLTQNTGW